MHKDSRGPLKLWSLPVLILLLFLISACAPLGGSSNAGGSTPVPKTTVQPSQTPASTINDVCPPELSASPNCQTPRTMQVAYGVESLIARGFTGKGQTVIDIVSFGSPTLQADMDVFDKQFGLPPITIKVIRSEEHTSELQSQSNLVCRLLL